MLTGSVKKQKIANLFCILQIVSYILTLTSGLVPIVAASYLFMIINLFYIGLIHYKKISITDLVLFIFTTVSLIMFTLLSSSEYSSKFDFIVLGINAFLISILFQGLSALKFVFYLNWLVNIAVLYMAANSGFNIYFGDDIFLNSSRNIVSGYLILAILYYLFFCITLNKKISLLLIILFTVNCILLYGRTGISLSLIILAYSIFKVFNKTAIAFVVLGVVFSFNIIYQFIMNSTKFSSGLETGRSEIYYEYFHSITIKDIFFGRSINDCCSTIVSFAGNPHNSFIHGHMLHGIAHTILFLLIFLTIVLTRKIDIIFLVSLVYLRHMLDWLGFFSIFDVVLFSMFIYSYKIINNK